MVASTSNASWPAAFLWGIAVFRPILHYSVPPMKFSDSTRRMALTFTHLELAGTRRA